MNNKTLDQLIASLKTEAIEAAEKESDKILGNAKQQAKQILQTAKEKGDMMVSEAELEAQAILKKGESAFRQAARDYSISVRNELLRILHSVLEEETRKEFTSELLKTAILIVIDNIDSDVELKLSEEFSEELSDYIHDRLKSSDNLVSIIEDNSVLKGFAIKPKNQGWSYSISPEEVAEALKNHLNNNWIKILKKESE